MPLPPEAWAAVIWTIEHLAPWGGRKAMPVALRFLQWYQESKAFREVERLAAETPASDCVRAFLFCRPGTSHGIVENRLHFGLNLVAVAPFGIRPHELNAKCKLWHGGACSETLRLSRKLVSSFKGLGGIHQEQIQASIVWPGPTPPVGSAVQLEMAGSVTLCGPWSIEYQAAEFADSIFVQVR
jgi:hypothetical protein